jgi:hypothetical protein
MTPQHSSPALAEFQWRHGLQEDSCTNYTVMRYSAVIKSKLRHFIPCSISFLSCWHKPWIIGDRADVTSSLHSTPSDPGATPQDSFPRGCSSGALRQFNSIDKQQIFNRTNRSSGDPPGSGMHLFKTQRVTPFYDRLVSDSPSMVAGREMQIFNHFLPLRTSSRTERVQARMHGPEINNNSTKNKG